MALARFRKICLDAQDPTAIGPFWAALLRLDWRPDHAEGGLFDDTGRCVVWVNRVPQAGTGKNRIHLDTYTAHLAEVTGLGATTVLPEGDDRRWSIMADPEGNEFCVFVRDDPPAQRLHGLGVHADDHAAIARWWHDVVGGDLSQDPRGWSTIEGPLGPGMAWDFDLAGEPKVGPGRMHWDLAVDDVDDLLQRGATMVRPRGDDREWDVLADPEGNEFCAFTQ